MLFRSTKLWMGEGFVEQIEGSTLEEVADSYLVELTFRNMLQVVERNEFGRPRRCKMHDLLREFALSISVKEKFGVVHDGGEEMKECKARRISFTKPMENSNHLQICQRFALFLFLTRR